MNKPAPAMREEFAKASRVICDVAENGNTPIGVTPQALEDALCQPPFDDCIIKIWRETFKKTFMQVSRGNPDKNPDILLNTSWNFAERTCTLERMEIAPHLQRNGLGTAMTFRLMDLAQKTGMRKITLEACLENGGYTWAKLFFPTPSSWRTLCKNYLEPRFYKYFDCMTKPAMLQVSKAIEQDDPSAILLIASIKEPTRDVPAGPWLLAHSCWNPIKEPPPSELYAYKLRHLQNTAKNRLAHLNGMVSDKEFECMKGCLARTSLTDIPCLIRWKEKVSGIPTGQLMLVGSSWEGEFDFQNPIQMAIYNAHKQAFESRRPIHAHDRRPQKPLSP